MSHRPMQKYRGSCHCGAVRFEIETDFPELTTCDCSICRRKNALMVKVHDTHFKMLEGEAAEKIRAAWSLFTPCTLSSSLLEAVSEAPRHATSGDVVLLSPACSSWDQFRNHQHRGEVFCQAVKSIGRGVRGGTPNINGKTVTAQP